MNDIPHLPILRWGRPYQSVDRNVLRDVRSGAPVVAVSQAHPGLVNRDLARAGEARAALAGLGTEQLLAIARRAGELFAEGTLPLGDAGHTQDVEQYLRQVSSTTGLPVALARRTVARLRGVLESLPQILRGLSRVAPEVLDRGFGQVDGVPVAFSPTCTAMGAILPNNSPGVHGLWQPVLALKTPVVLKPGRQEPWTPYRLAQAWIAAGCPAEAWGYYPADIPTSTEILLKSERSMLFGDASTTARWAATGKVQIHGPGWSKVVFGADRAGAWAEHLDLLVDSIAANGGRSCLNASGVWVPRESGVGHVLAEALADRLAGIVARGLDDPQAALAAFPNPGMARAIDAEIERQLRIPGAEDLTTPRRGTPRLIEVDGCTFLQPTLVHVTDPTHPLAQTELLFPFAAVVETPLASLPQALGNTLVLTAISEDPAFQAQLLAARNVDKLNLGPISTFAVDWQQPHEGNVFDLLYRRRALSAPPAVWQSGARAH
jgi:acyl-CoA reductase-like NAD-dependent aldehyde dehydrogenase